MAVNYRQIKAIEKKNKERILALCPNADDGSGIYFFTRIRRKLLQNLRNFLIGKENE